MKNPSQRLRDILENIDAIESFVGRMDQAEFTGDRKTVYAVTRALEMISEASRRRPKEMRDRHPSIDWAAVAAAGDVYRHEYEAVDEAQLWHTVQTGLSPLREMASAELDRLFSH
jgi:uncharacterized protein with HEPN domain